MEINRYLLCGFVSLFLTGSLTAQIQAVEEVPDSIGSSYDLGELVVTAQKNVVKSDGATLTYDIAEDSSSKGQTLLDVLKKVPMVTVDAQDNIYVKGSNKYRIYVNGREDQMLESNAATIFKSMPADAVSKIELITEPGAKYDAEGSGGIINLITEQKQKRDGYSGSVGLIATNRQYGANLFGSVKINKFNADANASYADNNGLYQINNTRATTINSDSDLFRRQETCNNQKVSFRFANAALNMSWEPSANDLFSWGGSFMWLDADIKKMTTSNALYSASNDLQYSFVQRYSGGLLNKGATANASWRHTFGERGGRLIAAYAFNFGKNGLYIFGHLIDSTGDNIMPDESNTVTDQYTREHTAQIDYSSTFGSENHLLETGAKGIFRRNSALNSSSYVYGDILVADDESNINTWQYQDVYALYASYTGTFGAWSIKGGVRYEHTYMGLDFQGYSERNFRRNLDDIVPNAAVTYSFGPAHNLRLAYQMRISRPTLSQLNPFRLELMHTQVQYGNPDLHSERNNNISLTYSNYGRILGGYIGATYSQSDDAIEQYTYRRDNVEYSTYGNLGKRSSVSIDGFLNYNISSVMTISVNGSVNYTDISAPTEGLHNSGWGGNYGANWSYSGPWDLKFSAFGGQSFRMINLNGYWSGWYYYGIGIKRDFLRDNKLTVGINATNFLQDTITSRGVTFGPGWRQNSSYTHHAWNIGISLTWNFGKLNERAKSSGLDISNNDTSNSGGRNSGAINL